MAVDHVTRRHPMLRTSFDLTDFSEPLQFVHPDATIPIEIEDMRHLTAEEQETAIVRWMEAEKHRRFEWNTVPLVRVHVHRRDEDSFQFSLSEPFLDGWSVASLVTEIFEHYSRLIKEESILAAPLHASYADFVALEQQTIASEESRRYWSEKFSDANGSRITGTSLLREQTGSPRVGRMDVPISEKTSGALHDLAAAEGLSIKSILLAAHCKVISVLSGQSGVFTGLFMNGRPEIEDGEKLIGMFLNILPFKLGLEAENWPELARQVAEEERRLLPHRRYPIQRLQHLYGAENLFDTAFNLPTSTSISGSSKLVRSKAYLCSAPSRPTMR